MNLWTIKWSSDHSFLLHAFEICNFCKSSFLKNLDHIKLVILLMHLLVLFKESEGPLKVTKAVTSVKHVDLFQFAFVNIDLTRDRTSHIFLHLEQSDECRNLCSKRSFGFYIKPTPIVVKASRIYPEGESNIEQAAQTSRACSFVLAS